MLLREDLLAACLSHQGAFEDFPFGEDVAVLKVQGKMFALLPVRGNPLTVSLKCDPREAELLREKYPAVTPGYHLNKTHWNSILIDGTVPDDEVLSMIEDSYRLVVAGFTKQQRQALEQL